MRSGHLVSLVAAALLANVAAGGCAGVTEVRPSAPDGGPSGTGGSGIPGIDARPGIDGITPAITTKCGNGAHGPRRAVRRRQQDGGRRLQRHLPDPRGLELHGLAERLHDGGRLRRRHPRRQRGLRRHEHDQRRRLLGGLQDASRPATSAACRRAAASPPAATAAIIGGEACDDGEHDRPATAAPPTCQIEPGASCTGATPSVCTAAICGNGMKEGNEGCDCGTSITGPWPTGCKGPNGLFFGDAHRLLEDLHQGAELPRPARRRRRAPSSCGNGNVEMGEACDDGNLDDGRRLLDDVHARGGLHVHAVDAARHRRLHAAGNTGECLRLPVIYRDFKNESVSGGHPDFFYLGAPVTEPGRPITGVQGRPARSTLQQALLRSQLERSGQEERLDEPLLGHRAGEPGRERQAGVQHGARRRHELRLPVHRLEPRHQRRPRPRLHAWRQSPTNGLTVQPTAPAATRCTAARRPSSPARPRSASGGWTARSPAARTSVGMLEMAPIGGGQYQFSSQVNAVDGGFFPLDPAAHGFPLYTPAPAGPGATPRWSGRRADALQPVAVLVHARPRSAPATTAAATSTCSRPA